MHRDHVTAPDMREHRADGEAGGEVGPVARKYYNAITDIQYGKGEDPLCIDTLIAESNSGSVAPIIDRALSMTLDSTAPPPTEPSVRPSA